jgi:TonB family protein
MVPMKALRNCSVILFVFVVATVCNPQVTRLNGDRIEAPEAWTKGNLLEVVDPDYPAELREQGIAGKVVVNIVIDKAGAVIAATPKEGNEQLSKLTLAAVWQWKFRPFVYEGKLQEVETTATVEFSQNQPFVRASKPMTLRVSQGVAQGNMRHKVAPEYPYEAKLRGIQGDVILAITITTTGDVANLHVISGDPLLTEAAIDAVKQWKYKPYLLKGQPVEVATTVKISFRM